MELNSTQIMKFREACRKEAKQQMINEFRELLKEGELMTSKYDSFRYLWKELKLLESKHGK